jgi:beta-glucosidase
MHEDDYPSIKGIGNKPYIIEYGYYHGYTKIDKEGKTPAYPFGYGLSYTSFEIASFTVEDSGDVFTIKASVKNIGVHAGAEVVQVYFGSAGAVEDRPIKLLKGFKRVELKHDEQKNVEISVKKDDLRFYDNGRWVLDAAYHIYVGNHSRDTHLPPITVNIRGMEP